MGKPKITQEILSLLTKHTGGLTIIDLENRMKYERHTLAKYLTGLEAQGVVTYRIVGRAKLYSISQIPAVSVLTTLDSQVSSYQQKVLTNILSLMPSGLVIVDRQYTVLYANAVAKKMLGMNGSSISSAFFYELLGYSNPLSLTTFTQLFYEGNTHSAELKTPKGYFSIRATKIENPDNSASLIFLFDDITHVRLAQIQVKEQKQLLEAERLALNQSAIVAETDLNGIITYVNEKFVKISGYSKKELIGKTHKIVNSRTHSKSFFANMWKTIRSGQVWSGIICNRRKNGTLYYVDSVIAPVLNSKKKPLKYISIRFDITEYVSQTKKVASINKAK